MPKLYGPNLHSEDIAQMIYDDDMRYNTLMTSLQIKNIAKAENVTVRTVQRWFTTETEKRRVHKRSISRYTQEQIWIGHERLLTDSAGRGMELLQREFYFERPAGMGGVFGKTQQDERSWETAEEAAAVAKSLMDGSFQYWFYAKGVEVHVSIGPLGYHTTKVWDNSIKVPQDQTDEYLHKAASKSWRNGNLRDWGYNGELDKYIGSSDYMDYFSFMDQLGGGEDEEEE